MVALPAASVAKAEQLKMIKIKTLFDLLPTTLQETVKLRLFGLRYIPMLHFAKPAIVAISCERAIVAIRLRRSTRNHLGSMYFGALGIGADCAVGVLAMHLIDKQQVPISLIFKSFSAEFLKRAESDVHFHCNQGKEIAMLVDQAIASKERVQSTVEVIATTPAINNEVVARFTMMLSLKRLSLMKQQVCSDARSSKCQ
jgi:hypothetical protein